MCMETKRNKNCYKNEVEKYYYNHLYNLKNLNIKNLKIKKYKKNI